jgi:hypothetical protein
MAAEIIFSNRIHHAGRDGAFDGDLWPIRPTLHDVLRGEFPLEGFGTVQRPSDDEPLCWHFVAQGSRWLIQVYPNGNGKEVLWSLEGISPWRLRPPATREVEQLIYANLHRFLLS